MKLIKLLKQCQEREKNEDENREYEMMWDAEGSSSRETSSYNYNSLVERCVTP